MGFLEQLCMAPSSFAAVPAFAGWVVHPTVKTACILKEPSKNVKFRVNVDSGRGTFQSQVCQRPGGSPRAETDLSVGLPESPPIADSSW